MMMVLKRSVPPIISQTNMTTFKPIRSHVINGVIEVGFSSLSGNKSPLSLPKNCLALYRFHACDFILLVERFSWIFRSQ